MKTKKPAFGTRHGLTGLHLFFTCHSFARCRVPHIQAQLPLLSGARLFYYTRRLLLGRGVFPEVNPDEVMLPDVVVEDFLRAIPAVAERLALEFPRAVRLRENPREQLMQLLSRGPLLSVPPLSWLSDASGSIRPEAPRIWERLWAALWREAEQEHLARLLVFMSPDRLPVAPVAPANASPHVALRLLWDRLARERERGGCKPAAEDYLYDQPLEQWLICSLLSGRLVFRCGQALVELLCQVQEGAH